MKKFIYFLILIATLTCIILIFLAPYLLYMKKEFGLYIYYLFSPLCHQIPEKSFFIFGFPLAVCARCTGIYIGMLIGTILYPFIYELKKTSLPSPIILILFALPMVIDVFGIFFHIWPSFNPVRFITGIIFGIILPFYLVPGIMDLSKLIFKPKMYPMKAKN